MGAESGPKPEDKVKDHAEKVDKELDKVVVEKSDSDKIKEIYKEVSKSLKPYVDEAEKNNDKSKVDRLIAKAVNITVESCKEQGINLNDKQKAAIKALFEGSNDNGKADDKTETGKTEGAKPNPDTKVIKPEAEAQKLSKLGEVSEEDMQKAIQKMPDTIELSLNKINNIGAAINNAKFLLSNKTNTAVGKAMDVKPSDRFLYKSVVTWADQKIADIAEKNVDQLSGNILSIQISPQEKQNLIKNFIKDNK